MAGFTEEIAANAREHRLIATAIADALDCVYLQYEFPEESDRPFVRPLTGTLKHPIKYLLPTLSHALGYCFESEDISLICMAEMSARTFWEYAVERLGLENSNAPRPSNAAITLEGRDIGLLQELGLSTFSNVRVNLGYCMTPSHFEFSRGYRISAAAIEGDFHLARLFDQQFLIRRLFTKLCKSESGIPRERATETFHFGFLRLCQWALTSGLLSSEVKMLDVECLLTLYSTYIHQSSIDLSIDPESFLKPFFNVYLSRLFEAQDAHDRLEILTPSGRNLTSDVEPENIQAFYQEIQRVVKLNRSLEELDLNESNDKGFTNFSSMRETYIKLNIRCWNVKHQLAFFASLPSILLSLQAQIRKTSKGVLSARIWPYALIDPSEDDDGNRDYLLGINATQDKHRSSQAQTLDSILSNFTTKLKYDRESALITYELLTSEALTTLLPSPTHQPLSRKLIRPQTLPTTTPTSSTVKFRTASATLNRLRWDPHHAAIDYEIGYVDRFEAELMWKSLEKWERHTEDEEFVPEHRIRKIRRKEDGVMVWDREARWDGTGGE